MTLVLDFTENLFQHWAFWALISSFFFAGISLWIQYFSISTKQAIVWRGIGCGLVLLPVLIIYEPPSQWEFYALVAIISSVAVYADFRIYEINRVYGAGLKNRIAPLVVFLTFILSLFIDYEQFHLYLEKPIISLGIVISLTFCVFSGLKLKSCDISKKAYIYALPTIICYSICNFLAKEALGYADNPTGSFYYALFQGWWIGSLAMLFVNSRPLQENETTKTIKEYLFSKQAILFGLVLGLIIAASMVTRNVAYYYAENVTYPVALGLLVPFWISIFYRFIKHKEEAAVLPGLGIVISAIALVLLTGEIH